MFHELHLSDWSGLVAVLAFVVTFSIFAAIVIGTLRCPGRTIEHLENLPWKDEKKS
jgi:hypothetical protein